ncbi:hypothetical protein JAAARDRAFT_115459, partial [Jaapia argillacea MUCL 33604]
EYEGPAQTKGLWGLVSGTLPCPIPTVEGKPTGDEKKLLRGWKAEEEEVTGLLWLALKDGQKVHVKGKEDDAVVFWKASQAVHLQQFPGTCFNAMNSFLSIRKLPDKSLTSLMAQVDKGMQDLKALCPSDYTIEKLNTELHSMALICALPAEYNTFVSSLLL